MELTYSKQGDYFLPRLMLKHKNKQKNLGRYARLRLNYIKQYNKIVYKELVFNNKLSIHLIDIEEQSKEVFKNIVEIMVKQENVTEELKEKDQFKWVRKNE